MIATKAKKDHEHQASTSPFHASVRMTKHHCVAQILTAGGSAEYCATATTPGGTTSYLVDVTPGANHSIIEEKASVPRVASFSSGPCIWHHCLMDD